MPELAVSTWSLHRTLGPIYPDLEMRDGDRAPDGRYGEGSLSLLETPAFVAAMGLANLEVCHFHFPSTDAAYLAQLRAALHTASVHLTTLLIDDGDIAAPDPATRQRDMQRIKGWIDVAAGVGARRVRVIAGLTGPDADGAAVQRSAEGLAELAAYARERGVGVITENWHALAARPEHLLAILDGTGDAVGLCADFGNYRGPTRYDDLQAILPRAVSVHAKADATAPGAMDVASFRRLLDLAQGAGFDGTYVLIFDDEGDERESLLQRADVVRPYLSSTQVRSSPSSSTSRTM